MKKSSNNNMNTIIKCIIYCFFIILFSLSSFFCFKYYRNNKQEIKVEYKDTWKTDYMVHYMPNEYYDEQYTMKCKENGNENCTYINSLIDYIDVDFNYNMIYSDLLSGKYSYKIVATVLAKRNAEDTNNLLNTEFILQDTIYEEFNNLNVFSIDKNIRVDYQKYTDFFKEYRKNIGLALNGILRIELHVESLATKDNVNGFIEKAPVIYIEMPLSSSYVDIQIQKTNGSDITSKVLDTIYTYDFNHYLSLGILILSIGGICLFTFLIIMMIIKKRNSENVYQRTLHKILSTYNSIIVNTNSVSNLENYNIITVNSFDELLDAHSEIRMPINFVEDKTKKKCQFILINEGIAWIYELSKSERKKKTNEKK